MDIQLTDYENTALIVALGMITNVLNNFDVDFFLPISLVDVNMERAHARDGLLTQKFFWKTNNLHSDSFDSNLLPETKFEKSGPSSTATAEDQIHELYVHEILCGKAEIGYVGLLPLIEKFMEKREFKEEEKMGVREYLSFLKERAEGKVKTGARYIRDLIETHPSYKQDSVVSDDIATFVIKECIELASNSSKREAFLTKKVL